MDPKVLVKPEAQFLNYIDGDGTYTGPETWDNSSVHVVSHDGIKSLGRLKRLTRSLFCASAAFNDLGDLEYASSDLSIILGSVTEAPNLKYVGGTLSLPRNFCGSLPNVKRVSSMILESEAAVPFIPKLNSKCRIIFNVKNLSVSLPRGKEPSVALTSYEECLHKVVNTPTIDLVSLRNAEPRLEHLINAKLKGLL